MSTSKKSKTHQGRQRISSRQVAELAGVSQPTVSRAFTPGANISEETRNKVLEAAEKIGYRPNVIARSLTQQSTKMIGLVVGDFKNPFYSRLIDTFSVQLQQRGYWSLLLNVPHEAEIESTLPMALQYQVAGIIVTSATLTSTLADECESYGTPVVLFNRYPLQGNLNAVKGDNEGGGRIVADALLDGGHKRIAYIAGQEGSSTNRNREKGFTERLLEHGYHVFARESGDYYYNSGYNAAQRLLSNDDKPDAIFCANDLMAMATMDVARRQFHLKVPGDLSIIGFDDIQMASWPTYSLTTLHQPVKEMVNATIDILIDTVHEVSRQGVVRMCAGELIDRGSARLVSDGE